jgi:tetratricopeptide (TPR) repeat protein
MFTYSQSKTVAERYDDVKHYRNASEDRPKFISLMVSLLSDSSQLSLKQITALQYHIGRMYEEVKQPDSAIVYYEKSLKGEPNYEVIHRALAFIYLEKSKPFVALANSTKLSKDVEGNATAYNEYKKLVQKAVPYLEKYQACSPDEETLSIIINLYKSIKDSQSVATLPERLKVLGTTCVTLLDDE